MFETFLLGFIEGVEGGFYPGEHTRTQSRRRQRGNLVLSACGGILLLGGNALTNSTDDFAHLIGLDLCVEGSGPRRVEILAGIDVLGFLEDELELLTKNAVFLGLNH